MPRLRLADLLAWSGGRLIAGGKDGADPGMSGVSTDTRTLAPGGLFLALHGQKQDGHLFLDQALDAGAGGLLIDDRAAFESLPRRGEWNNGRDPRPVILTPDTLKSLQDLAAGYRQTLPGKVVGITGSIGKTSTRQMIGACLQPMLAVHQTKGNLNNEIGLPQTLLQAEADQQAIILEMAMRGPGEIALLSRIANPDIAILTCIGLSHIERLGSQAAILAAKSEILEGLRPGGLLILNRDDLLLHGLGRTLAGRYRLAYVSVRPNPSFQQDPSLLTDPCGNADPEADFVLLAEDVAASAVQTSFNARLRTSDGKIQDIPVSLLLPGEHHILSSLFGLAVAHELHADLLQAAAGAATCRPCGNRQRLVEAGGILIMDDSYNASPESMRAALRTLSGLAGSRRKIAALGGMLELGDFAAAAHREAGAMAAGYGFNLLLLTGPQANEVAAGALASEPDLDVGIYPDNLALAGALVPRLRSGDCLLVKGSRGFAMEQVTEAVLKGLASREGDA